MKVIKLADNQVALKTPKKITFISYETIVCTITNFENGNKPIVKIKKGQPESRTTTKYLNQFLDIFIGVKNYKEI